MGVAWVYEYLISDPAKQSSQVISEIQKHLEASGAMKSGTFFADCTPYVPKQEIASLNKTAFLCHHSAYPESSFTLIMEPNLNDPNRPKIIHAISDMQFDLILNKLQPAFTARPSHTAEARGPVYKLKDFTIRVGAVSISASFKGILIEIEYGPCIVAGICQDLMKEFCHSLLGPIAANPPKNLHLQRHLRRDPNQPFQLYTAIDTICQYMEYFGQFRKQQQVPQIASQLPPQATPSFPAQNIIGL